MLSIHRQCHRHPPPPRGQHRRAFVPNRGSGPACWAFFSAGTAGARSPPAVRADGVRTYLTFFGRPVSPVRQAFPLLSVWLHLPEAACGSAADPPSHVRGCEWGFRLGCTLSADTIRSHTRARCSRGLMPRCTSPAGMTRPHAPCDRGLLPRCTLRPSRAVANGTKQKKTANKRFGFVNELE